MKCRKVIKDEKENKYDIVRFGSYGTQDPYAIVFKSKESDDMPELELNAGIYTNKIYESGSEIGDIIIKNIDINNKKLTYNIKNGSWISKTWNLNFISGHNIWTDGTTIYYSQGMNEQYILDKNTNLWKKDELTISYNIYGFEVWSDGNNIYYSHATTHFRFTGNSWVEKTWNGLDTFYGEYIWSDGTNIYYSNGSTQKVLDKATSTWNNKTWNGILNNNFSGYSIWTDGDNIYYSSGTNQKVLNKETSTWEWKDWNGLIAFSGRYIWTDGDNIYYSYGINHQYVLDKESSTWLPKIWGGKNDLVRENIWTDGINFYYSFLSEQYVLNKEINNKLLICYYNEKMYKNNKTNIMEELSLEISPSSLDQEVEFDIVQMSKKWKDNEQENYATKQEGVASSLIQRLSIIQGELWYQINYGLPLLSKIKDKFIYDSIIINIILKHPDVREIITYQSKLDNTSSNHGTYSFSCSVMTTYNETITLSTSHLV